MKILFVINDPPYGTERTYNALRHIHVLAQREGVEVKGFFMADAVASARQGQKTPNGYYNLERMMKVATGHQVEFGACGSCMDARGLIDDGLVQGVHRSSMDELCDWTLWADQVITY